MNKKIKKLLILAITVCILFTSVLLPYEKTKAVSLEVGLIVLGVAFIGSACFACDYLSNPDKYSDLTESMKDFKNSTVENQKKLYEIEKANFEMVMQKAVDAGIGSCLVGSDGKLYSATQLQAQEYPSFDTWKGYKEKESQKPKKSMWDKFKMLEPFAGLLLDLFPDSSTGGSSDAEDEQLYYTGDDGYIDRETGELSISFTAKRFFYDWTGSDSTSGFRTEVCRFTCTDTINPDDRVYLFISSYGNNSMHYTDPDDGAHKSCPYRSNCFFGYLFHGMTARFESINVSIRQWSSNDKDYIDKSFIRSSYSPLGYSCHIADDNTPSYRLWDCLSTNIPVFENSSYAQAYRDNGSLEGLINGAPEQGPTPTDAPAPDSHIGPVQQYTNYFSTNFSPSVMPYYVNYNIVNNWDGDTNTFNINNYTVEESDDNDVTATPTPDSKKPTFTPIPPNTDGGDTTNNYDINITNNLLIEQTNIIQNISNTVNNIYNFFRIDVDVIVEDLTPDTDSKFMPLYDMITDVNKLIPQDEFEVIEGQADPIISTLYPKITIKVPVILDDFLSFSDKKIMEEDGSKVIILCDFYDFRIYFARFRKFLQIVIYIGMFFYLMKEFSVIWSIQ